MNLVIFHSFILTILNGLEFVDGSPLDSWKCYLSVDNIIWFVVKIATNTPTHRESTSTFLSRALFLCSQFNQSSFTPWLDHKLEWPIWMGKVLVSRKNKSRNSLVHRFFTHPFGHSESFRINFIYRIWLKDVNKDKKYELQHSLFVQFINCISAFIALNSYRLYLPFHKKAHQCGEI